MNAQELHAAADRLDVAARQRTAWASRADTEAGARLYREVAMQLKDRADQVRSWARSAAWHEQHPQDYPAGHAERIERAVREFLLMAGD